MHRVSLRPDYHRAATRAGTLVVAVTGPGSALDAEQQAVLAACAGAGVTTLTIALATAADTAEALGVLARRFARSAALDRAVLFGTPAETAVLLLAGMLNDPSREVAVAWELCRAGSPLALQLTRERAALARVIPYTVAALAAELDLALPAPAAEPAWAAR